MVLVISIHLHIKHTSYLIQTLGITTAGSCVVWTAAQTKQTKAKSMSHKISSSSLDPLNWSRDQKGEEGKGEVSVSHHCKFLFFIIIFFSTPLNHSVVCSKQSLIFNWDDNFKIWILQFINRLLCFSWYLDG